MSVLFEEALKLSEVERRKLADDIYLSLEESAEHVDLTPEQETELERRIEHHRQHPDDFVPWEDVLERLRLRA